MQIEYNEKGLLRFLSAQENTYSKALEEIKEGRKDSHWMWFIFPQIDGLGYSLTTRYYALMNLKEAEEFLAHPILGPRLIGISNELLKIENKTAKDIFRTPDDNKLRSCMTIFSCTKNTSPVFELVLKKYFGGLKDENTMMLISEKG